MCDNYTFMTVARHYRVSGRVQRVGFRYFVYDAAVNRAVAVDSRALIEALRKVYHADRIVNEMVGKQMTAR